VVLAGGRVEQAGSPHEVYDNPANPFVMRFLGPVTELDGRLVRPHDLALSPAPEPGSTEAVVERVTRLGFEVRVELRIGDRQTWAQVTRGAAEELGLVPGAQVYLRPLPGALSLAAATP
jgi:sulfate transport system ATP-binding protein